MKQRFLSFMAGLLTGAVLLSGGAAYAVGIMAEHAPQTAYVDGVAVQMEAYNSEATTTSSSGTSGSWWASMSIGTVNRSRLTATAPTPARLPHRQTRPSG